MGIFVIAIQEGLRMIKITQKAEERLKEAVETTDLSKRCIRVFVDGFG
jgi:Fe-S cluster assembly iron-binding protein IscA